MNPTPFGVALCAVAAAWCALGLVIGAYFIWEAIRSGVMKK